MDRLVDHVSTGAFVFDVSVESICALHVDEIDGSFSSNSQKDGFRAP